MTVCIVFGKIKRRKQYEHTWNLDRKQRHRNRRGRRETDRSQWLEWRTYLQCWEVDEIISGTGFGIKEDGLCVRPVYKQIDNNEWEIIGYKFC